MGAQCLETIVLHTDVRSKRRWRKCEMPSCSASRGKDQPPLCLPVQCSGNTGVTGSYAYVTQCTCV